MGNSHKNLLVWNQLLNWNQTLIKQSLDGPLQKLCLVFPPSDQDGCTAVLSLTQDPMGNSHRNHLVWNQQLNQNQTLMEQSLDGPLPKLCLAVALSHQDGHRSAVALLLKAALIQVSDYRLLGASCIDATFLLWFCIYVVYRCERQISKLLNMELVLTNYCTMQPRIPFPLEIILRELPNIFQVN